MSDFEKKIRKAVRAFDSLKNRKPLEQEESEDSSFEVEEIIREVRKKRIRSPRRGRRRRSRTGGSGAAGAGAGPRGYAEGNGLSPARAAGENPKTTPRGGAPAGRKRAKPGECPGAEEPPAFSAEPVR
jgi:hypothetical protein